MSTEIDRLKADISVLERVGREGGYANGYAVDPLIGQMKCKLERLEEEAKDPHQEAKNLLEIWEMFSDSESDLRKVANYVKFLKHEIHLVIRERDQLRNWMGQGVK